METNTDYFSPLGFKEQFLGDPDDELSTQIIEIIKDNNLSVKSKVQKCLYLQFLERRDIWSSLELLSLCYTLAGQKIDPNILDEITAYKRLLSLVKHNLITFKGIDEIYSEYGQGQNNSLITKKMCSELKKHMGLDIAKLVKKEQNLSLLLNLYKSCDVIKLIASHKKKLKSYKVFIKQAELNKNLYYRDWLEAKRNWLLLNDNTSENYDFDTFEQNKKFAIPNGVYFLVKSLRKKSIFFENIEEEELSELYSLLGPKNFKKTTKILWRGLATEYKRLKKIKNPERRNARVVAFYKKYESSAYVDRILRLLSLLI